MWLVIFEFNYNFNLLWNIILPPEFLHLKLSWFMWGSDSDLQSLAILLSTASFSPQKWYRYYKHLAISRLKRFYKLFVFWRESNVFHNKRMKKKTGYFTWIEESQLLCSWLGNLLSELFVVKVSDLVLLDVVSNISLTIRGKVNSVERRRGYLYNSQCRSIKCL